jgi:hypothetical protein
MSIQLSYTKTVSTTDGISSLDGDVKLVTPLNMNPNTSKSIRLIKFTISSNIPNVYNVSGSNNGLVRVTRDGGTSWTSIQLDPGIYTTSLIAAAINATIESWYTDSSDPALNIAYNTATQKVYTTLDSTKLAVGGTQIGIDFADSSSLMGTLLGYTTTTSFVTDGDKEADSYAQLNWISDSINVELGGFGSLSIINGQQSNTFFTMNLATETVTNQYEYPSNGIVSPWIIIQNMSQLQTYSVKIRGSNGRTVYLLEGRVELVFELREIILRKRKA